MSLSFSVLSLNLTECCSAEAHMLPAAAPFIRIFLTLLIWGCREQWHRKSEENESKQTNKRASEPDSVQKTFPVTSEQQRSWMLPGWSRQGLPLSLCVCPCVIFRAGYQQRQHENKPVAAGAFSHDATSADGWRGMRHKQDSVAAAAGQLFHFYIPTVCFEHGLKQLHPCCSVDAIWAEQENSVLVWL